MPALDEPPTLLVAAHGTDTPAGSATTAALVDAVRAARPAASVELCFLDVAMPSLRDAVERLDRPAVVVPLLLSTGYHVRRDIPSVVAGHPEVRVAAHLGPDPLVIDALVDRLHPAATASTALVAVGSSMPEARAECAVAARLLGARIGRPVQVLTLDGDVGATLSALPPPVRVATYLLAPGRFLDALHTAADGIAEVAEPIGTHPALVELVWQRYDAVG